MIIFLDTNVLGALVNPSPKSAEVKAMQAWASQMQAAGHFLIVPAIVDYEQRREQERRPGQFDCARHLQRCRA